MKLSDATVRYSGNCLKREKRTVLAYEKKVRLLTAQLKKSEEGREFLYNMVIEQRRYVLKTGIENDDLKEENAELKKEVDEVKHKLKVEKSRTNHVAEIFTLLLVLAIFIILYIGEIK
jgi:hypothetical protein